MAEIAPLKPLRYDPAKLANGLAGVVAPPYDVIHAEERATLAARDPYNVVRLILPEGEGDSKYAHAAELMKKFRDDKVLVRDEQPAFYRYDQTFVPPGGTRSFKRTGFLGLIRLVPFSDRIVLPHERTLSGPKEDRLKLFRSTRTNLSPGFMLYRDAKGEVDSALAEGELLADFETTDGIRQVLTKVSRPEALATVVRKIAQSSLLIADGHHRYETALRYAGETGAAGSSENGWFMVFFANGDDPNLLVFPTHRYVHSLAKFDFAETVRGAKAIFDVAELPENSDAKAILAAVGEAGKRAPSVAMASPSGDVVVLTLREGVDLAAHPTLGAVPEALRRTDVALLHTGLFEHVLGMTREAQAAKTNLFYPQDATASLGELRGGKAAAARLGATGAGQPAGQALFLMNATPVEVVRRVAEAGEVMPQKSTFFYPKVLTGLTVHTLEPDRTVASV